MSAFAIAVATLFADANMATDAMFVPQLGASVSLRVILRGPDLFAKMGSSVIETPTTTLEVQVADCPQPTQGDHFVIGLSHYIVQGEPRRDELQLTWLVDVYAA